MRKFVIEGITVEVDDEADIYEASTDSRCLSRITFQNGTIPEAGINGVTNELLLKIVADRLLRFQASEFKCKENACAITHIEEAIHWLDARTKVRKERGVEDTLKA